MIRRLLCLFSFFICLLTSQLVFARDFIIVATPQAPFKFIENGAVKGIDIEIIDEVMKRLEIPYKILFVKSDARIQAEARNGTVDMLLLYSKKKSRMDYLIYPEQSYIDLTWNFFIRKEDEKRIKFTSFDDLKALKIAATNGVSYTHEFWTADLDLILTSKIELHLPMLLAYRVDTTPLNTITTLYEAKKKGLLSKISFLPKPLKTKAYYNTFVKASSYPLKERLIKRYNSIVADMKKDGTIQKIFNKYLQDDTSTSHDFLVR